MHNGYQAANAINRWAAAFEARLLTSGKEKARAFVFILRRDAALRGFGHATLPEAQVPRTKTPVFYFFSGMDVLTLHSLFPEAPEYMMLAEWPPGHYSCFESAECMETASASALGMVEHVTANANFQSTRIQKRNFERRAPHPRREFVNGRMQVTNHTEPVGILSTMAAILWLVGHKFRFVEMLPAPLSGIALTTESGARFAFVSHWLSSNQTRAVEQLETTRLLGFRDRKYTPFVAMFKAGTHTIARRDWFAKWIMKNAIGTLQEETGITARAVESACALGARSPWGVSLHGDINQSMVVYRQLIRQANPDAVRSEYLSGVRTKEGIRAEYLRPSAKARVKGRRQMQQKVQQGDFGYKIGDPCPDNGMGCPHELEEDRLAMWSLAQRVPPRPSRFKLGYAKGSGMVLAGWAAARSGVGGCAAQQRQVAAVAVQATEAPAAAVLASAVPAVPASAVPTVSAAPSTWLLGRRRD